MTAGRSGLDIVLVLILLAYAVTGYRQGLLRGGLSLVGFLAGGALALWLLPVALRGWQPAEPSLLHTVVLVLAVFVCAAIGQGITARVGARLHASLRLRPVRALDSLLGAVAVVAAVSLMLWFVAGAARGAAPAPVGKAIGQSRVLRAINAVVPQRSTQLFEGFRAILDREGFPEVFSGLRAEPIEPVPPPASGVLGSAGMTRAAGSVVKITGPASCGRIQEGSGWVVAKQRVVTNAHVVAGVRSPSVRIGGVGHAYPATVVVFDPRRDLAVLAVPRLPARPLPLGRSLRRGDGAAVAGFPLDGPYRLRAARVRGVLHASGADIYGKTGAVRTIYSLYTTVQSGNSGGPLLSPSGAVVGVVFAKSLDDDRTGYALTLSEARPVLDRADRSTRVSSGSCAAA